MNSACVNGEARVRVLLIAEAANPEMTSVPLEGWSHSRALTELTDALTLTQVRNAEAFARAGVPASQYALIDSEAVARPLWRLSNLVRGGAGRGWTTVAAIGSISYAYFEHRVWRQFGPRIRRGDFDLVHRLTPLSPTFPSSLAVRCARFGTPFVLGPLNGGVPWPAGFDAARRREREWLSYIRTLHRVLPGHRATRRHASAIICGSLDTLDQMPAWCRSKCVYIPENAVDPARFASEPAQVWAPPLRVLFLGRLVPYKGADMLLEAAADLVRDGRAVIDLLGDGPERAPLEALVNRLGIAGGVTFHGWVPHDRVQHMLARAHVLGFPSIREFGGAVVLEAMAMGAVPLVVAYGGPGELISARTGVGVPMGTRQSIVAQFSRHLAEMAADPRALVGRSEAARERVRRSFTWDAKARQVLEVYRWVLGRRPDRPDFSPLRGDGPNGS